MPLPFTYFVKSVTLISAASDSNDGRDPLGAACTNATYDHTGGASGERQLTAEGEQGRPAAAKKPDKLAASVHDHLNGSGYAVLFVKEPARITAFSGLR